MDEIVKQKKACTYIMYIYQKIKNKSKIWVTMSSNIFRSWDFQYRIVGDSYRAKIHGIKKGG